MELKSYQKDVMCNLSSYLDCVNNTSNLFAAWEEYWSRQDIGVGFGGVPTYNNAIKGVPHVCLKVPTGGGKTFMACASVKRIFDEMPKDKPRVVVWLVPSDSILNQTIKTLSDVNHPYRQRLEADFAGRVGVYTKEQLLNGQNFSPDTVREMLTVCILSYGSLRIDSKKKDVRKVYQENGNLLRFAEYFNDQEALLADTPDTALIQVLRQLSPVTIVDESHNAGSDLSVEMLNRLNPSFVLDLTATPRKNSNILCYVDARELKKEHMVKLPVVVYNRTSRQSVIQDAIQLRGSIEQQAKSQEVAGGEYIRPIVLFQAQPNLKGKETDTYQKIKQTLIEIGIPEEEIAIKTSKIDDINSVDLMSKDCKIRYIITVNALKEGWDCPFAYILASLANKTSAVDVEQIVGRILRQPYAKIHSASLLNTSYVLTCSNDFRNTLENIVSGLNKAGFSRKDYRIGEITSEIQTDKTDVPQDQAEQLEMPIVNQQEDDFSDVSVEEVRINIEATDENSNKHVADMIQQATTQTQQYNSVAESNDAFGFTGGELGDMLTQNAIQDCYKESVSELRIPQFFMKTTPDLFGDEYELLEPENLSEDFTLTNQDSQISFELATGEMYRVDLQEQGDAVPKYKRASKDESEYLRVYLAQLPPETKIKSCTDMICGYLNKNDRYATSDINAYVRRIVENMTEDEIAAMETAIPVYAKKIKQKIETLEDAYREQQFYKWLDSGKVVCRENYEFPLVITPAYTTDSIPCSLYEAEKNDMNNFESRVLDYVVGLENIQWWHRIIDRKGFRINGFTNHYPDFVVKTKSGKIVMIETKGDDRDNGDSKRKLKLGRHWATQSGGNYRYFMVFDHISLEGAYTVDGFIDVMKNL